MITIWKFELKFEDKVEIEIPEGAEILTIQIDKKDNKPCLWALVDSNAETVTRVFELFGTGSELQYDMGVDRKYLGTYQYQKGEFVGHVFERIS